MIIDQSRIMCGTSVSRMSEYLSLCKIDCLVRKVDYSTPSRRVDQPSKVGQAGTMARPNQKARPRYTLRVDYTRKMGSRGRTLSIKNELGNKSGLLIESLTEAGTVILQQDGTDLELLPLYAVASCADNFAKTERKEWTFCLVVNKQEQWVKAFLTLLGRTRLQSDYVINIRQGQIRYYRVPKSKGGS